MAKTKVMIIFGTRPEAIKMAPVVKAFKGRAGLFDTVVCVSGQHRQMLDQVLSLFNINPDIDLDLMQENQSLDSLTAAAVKVLTQAIAKVKPQLILVQGDTTTAMAAALAGFYQKVPVGHVEAGLRTDDKYQPFPEEINRRMISVLATYHFAPTRIAAASLAKERVGKENIFLTGNTVIDALYMIAKRHKKVNFNFKIGVRSKLLLVTAHRRENFGSPLTGICSAIRRIVERYKDVEVVYPVHLNPNVRGPVYKMLSGIPRVHLTHPVEYHELTFLLKKAYLVLTDSGGIQEEAPAFGKPVLVMREKTERPEGITAGVARLVGTDTERIVREVGLLLRDSVRYRRMSKAVNPYGDGRAARRIVKAIIENAHRSPG